MKSVNVWAGTGNIVREGEFTSLPSGVSVLKFTIAVNESFVKDGVKKEDTAFIDVKVFGRFAEAIHTKVQKGRPCALSGKLKQDRWEQEGKKREKLYILAENISIFEPGKYEAGQSEEGQGFQDDIPF